VAFSYGIMFFSREIVFPFLNSIVGALKMSEFFVLSFHEMLNFLVMVVLACVIISDSLSLNILLIFAILE
jgi:hypothetical protein